MTTYQTLADRCRSTREPDRVLDGLLFKTLEEKPGDVWSDAFGDDVWHRRDPDDTVAYEGPPAYTSSLDAAYAAMKPGMRLTGLRERVRPDAADDEWRPCTSEVATDGITVQGTGHLLPCAIMDAILMTEARIAADI